MTTRRAIMAVFSQKQNYFLYDLTVLAVLTDDGEIKTAIDRIARDAGDYGQNSRGRIRRIQAMISGVRRSSINAIRSFSPSFLRFSRCMVS